MRDQLVSHEAAVDVDVLLVGPRASRFGQAGAACDAQHAQVQRYFAAGSHELIAQDVTQSLQPSVHTRGAPPLLHQLAFVPHRKAHVRACQRMAAHGFNAMGQLGGFGLEKLAPCRGAEKQLAHLHAGAYAARGGRQFTRPGIQPLRVRGVLRSAEDADLGDGANGGQRLTAKAHGGHTFQVSQRGDLAGGVATQRER